MKKLIFILLLFVSFGVKAQYNFPSLDSLRKYCNRFITNSAINAFTDYRLNTLLNGMIAWIDSAGGGSSGVDSIWAINDSTIRYRKGLSLINVTIKGGRDVDTIYRKAGQDSLFFTINGIERAVKDSSGAAAPILTATQIAYGSGTNTITSEAALNYDATLNRLSADSALFIKARMDSANLKTNTVTAARIESINAFGNSITLAVGATTPDSGYINKIRDYLKVDLYNWAESGTGIWCMSRKHNKMINGYKNSSATFAMTGYNDRSSGTDQRTYNKIGNGIRAMIANHFADYYIEGGSISVTRYGTWTTGDNVTQWGGKTYNGAYTSTVNDSITFNFVGDNIAIATIGGDSLTYNHSIVEVFVDNVSKGLWNTNNQSDGFNQTCELAGKLDTRMPYVIIIGGLTNALHRVKVVNTTSRIMYIDYFARLSSTYKPPFIVFNNIRNAASTPAIDGGNANIDSNITALATVLNGFPIKKVTTNSVFSYITGLSGDNIHPNDVGYQQIVTAFRNMYDSLIMHSEGTLVYNGRPHFTTRSNNRQTAYVGDVWAKGDAQMNLAGNVNIDSVRAYQQQGYDVLKTSTNLNVQVGYLAMNNTHTGVMNVAVGGNALSVLTTGTGNTAIGARTLLLNTTGASNTAIGGNALNQLVSGTNNTAVGATALRNATSSFNTAVGSGALFTNTSGSENTAVGYNAGMSSTTVSGVTSVGYNSLASNLGARNTAVGAHSLELNTSGDQNVAVGSFAMATRTTGQYNIAIGDGAGYAGGSGDNNTFLGGAAGANLTSGSRNTAIGQGVNFPSATGSNQLNISNIIYGRNIDGSGSTVSTGGITIGTSVSSPRRLYVEGSIGANKDTGVTKVTATGIHEMVVMDTTTGRFHRTIISSGADGNGLYGGNGGAGGDGSLPGNTTITGAGNTLTITGTQSSSAAFNVSNTGNGSAGAFSTTGTGSALSGTNSSSGNGLFGSSSSGNGLSATSVTGLAGRFKITPSSTNTVVDVMDIIRGSSGTMATGGGGLINMKLTDDGGNDVTGIRIGPVFTSAATGSTTTDLQIFTTNAGSSTLKFTLKGNGQLRLHGGYGTNTFTGTATTSAQFDVNGNIIEGPAVTSGTYTPTLTNTTNVAASTAYQFQWSRVGNTITFSGEVDIDPTAGLTLTVLTMTLPVVPGFANSFECAGTAADDLGTVARVRATASAGTAEVRMTPTDASNRRFSVHGTYLFIAP